MCCVRYGVTCSGEILEKERKEEGVDAACGVQFSASERKDVAINCGHQHPEVRDEYDQAPAC